MQKLYSGNASRRFPKTANGAYQNPRGVFARLKNDVLLLHLDSLPEDILPCAAGAEIFYQ